MEKKKIAISVIVLTKNEEPVIKDCLESIKWADEIIVVDHDSTDKTLEIVKKFDVEKIINAPKESSFSDRRNLGAKNASGEWLLYVDADERVTAELKAEIQSLLTSHLSLTTSAYAIPRKNIRLTKILYHGGWWPDYVLRLMKKDKLIKWEGDLHEQPKIDGRVGKLKKAFLHFSHRGSFEHKMQNTINWSKIEAEKLYQAGHPPMTVLRFISAMWREFYKRMIRYQAWRDGIEGVIEAIYQVFSVFVTYARLWEMQSKNASQKN